MDSHSTYGLAGISTAAAAMLVVLLACVPGSPAGAQSTEAADTTETRLVEILHADSSSGFARQGQRIRSLQGNVRLKQDSTFLTADRVLQYVESDSIRFIGSVRIVDQGDTLWARRLLYNQRTRIGQADGEVELTDGEVVMHAPSVRYSVEDRRAEFSEGARMRDSVSVLTSTFGTYWFEEKKAILHENVRMEQPGTILTSDSLVHYREEDRSIGYDNVVINHFERSSEAPEADTTRRTILFGERAEHDNRVQYRRITGDPFLVQLSFDSTGTDTLLLRAEEIRARETDERRHMQAVGDVGFWQRRFSAIADSVAYERSNSTSEENDQTSEREDIRLYREPIAWLDRTQISGDTLKAAGRGEQIDSLWVYSRAFVASEDSLTGQIHQLKGEDLRARMRNSELAYVRVGPHGEALRYLTDENDAPDGAVQMSADYIEGWFEAGAITRAKAVGGIEGTYYEESNIPESLALEGFNWQIDRRPTKGSMLETSERGDRFVPVTYKMRGREGEAPGDQTP